VENRYFHLDYIDCKRKKAKVEIINEELFLKRLVLHILPKGFQKIRFYGFIANRCRKSTLALCRMLLGIPLCKQQEETDSFNDIVYLFWKYFRVDISLCFGCGKGHLFLIKSNSKGG